MELIINQSNAAKLIHIHWITDLFIYLQNGLQQDFWITFDPQGDNGVQVHNTCTHGVNRREIKRKTKSTLCQEKEMDEGVCKARDTASPASTQTSFFYGLHKSLGKVRNVH